MKLRNIKESGNFNGREFVNPVPTVLMESGKLWDTMRQWNKANPNRKPSQKPGPFKSDISSIKSVTLNSIEVVWLGHSTLLIAVDGKIFLTDPVWSERASPFPFMGPKRFFDVPVSLDELPELHGIILSHDHYDHLDRSTIRKLGKLGLPFFCPLGLGRYLKRWGIKLEQIREFDWWEELQIDKDFSLIAAPARHFSGRGPFNRNNTLWVSWILSGKHHKVFFGGDSGLFPGFQEIGDKFGPFDLTLLEIGAYHSNWGTIHMGPVNAITAQIMLKGKVLLPIHWGTFNLALHGWTEPVDTIIPIAEKNKITLLLPVPGKSYTLPDSSSISYWWKF